jgi:hypothetical protein
LEFSSLSFISHSSKVQLEKSCCLLSLLVDKYYVNYCVRLVLFSCTGASKQKSFQMFLSKIPLLSSAAKQLVTKQGPQFSAAAAAQVKPNPNPEIKHTGVRKEHTKTFTICILVGYWVHKKKYFGTMRVSEREMSELFSISNFPNLLTS